MASALDGIFATASSTQCPLGRRFADNNIVQKPGERPECRKRRHPILVESNAANRNSLDGIKLGSTHATVNGNRAWWNGNLQGIEALDGTAGSGNSARRNGNAAQCVPASLCTAGTP